MYHLFISFIFVCCLRCSFVHLLVFVSFVGNCFLASDRSKNTGDASSWYVVAYLFDLHMFSPFFFLISNAEYMTFLLWSEFSSSYQIFFSLSSFFLLLVLGCCRRSVNSVSLRTNNFLSFHRINSFFFLLETSFLFYLFFFLFCFRVFLCRCFFKVGCYRICVILNYVKHAFFLSLWFSPRISLIVFVFEPVVVSSLHCLNYAHKHGATARNVSTFHIQVRLSTVMYVRFLFVSHADVISFLFFFSFSVKICTIHS